MKVVLDTNIFVSGLMLPTSKPGQIVKAWRSAHFDIALCEAQLQEIERVLAYPKIQQRLQWNDETIARYLLLLRFKADIIDIATIESPQVPDDIDDSTILATLIASDAECLVTGDSDLLKLSDDHPIITPNEFVKWL